MVKKSRRGDYLGETFRLQKPRNCSWTIAAMILVSFILKHTSTAGKYAAFDLGIFAIPTHQSHTVTVYCIYKKYFLTLH